MSGLKFSSRNRKVEIKNTSRERYKVWGPCWAGPVGEDDLMKLEPSRL